MHKPSHSSTKAGKQALVELTRKIPGLVLVEISVGNGVRLEPDRTDGLLHQILVHQLLIGGVEPEAGRQIGRVVVLEGDSH